MLIAGVCDAQLPTSLSFRVARLRHPILRRLRCALVFLGHPMLTEAQKADGWIEHDGGPMPTNLAAYRFKIVEVLADNGATNSNYAALFTWLRNSNRPSIIAYRLEQTMEQTDAQ